MMDDANYTLPEGGGTHFTKEEWTRMKKKMQEISNRLAKRCKHLIKSDEPPKRRKVDWEKIKAERERLEQKERDALREADGFEQP